MSEDLDFIKPENLEENLRGLGKSFCVTRGHWERRNDCEACDLAWNHLDQQHRPRIHGTYRKAVRFYRSRRHAVSLSSLSFFGLPMLVTVNDIQVGEGLYYQTFTLFNLLHVHMINRIQPDGPRSLETLDWFVVSHRFLKFLHAPLSHRFAGIMQSQSDQDVPIRKRRASLRAQGYHFDTDKPDMMNSNHPREGVFPPPLKEEARIPLSGLEAGKIQKISAGGVEWLVLAHVGGEYQIWPEVCPHQGGPLSEAKLCKGKLECPWHGFHFEGARLSAARPETAAGFYTYRLEAGNVKVTMPASSQAKDLHASA